MLLSKTSEEVTHVLGNQLDIMQQLEELGRYFSTL
jgi:hypothetical protein